MGSVAMHLMTMQLMSITNPAVTPCCPSLPATVQAVLPSACALHVQGHSPSSGAGSPLNLTTRILSTPPGAPTGMTLPLAAGEATLYSAQPLSPQRWPAGACGR